MRLIVVLLLIGACAAVENVNESTEKQETTSAQSEVKDEQETASAPGEGNSADSTTNATAEGNETAGEFKRETIYIDMDNPTPAENKPRKMPEKTRLLFYEYSLETKTLIYEENAKEESAIEVGMKLKYAFDILHHDTRGNILARYHLLECISGPCDYRIPDVYIDFVQGGNNIDTIFAALEEGEKPSWNPMFAAMHAVQTPAVSGAGDEQNVVTPYGLCHYRFSKPQDKRFRRRMSGCSLEGIRNHTLIPGATVHKYEQEILYIQNTKVDADIVNTYADEMITIRSPLNNNWNITFESHLYTQMLNRSLQYAKRLCPYESSATECAVSVFKATPVGKNWRELKRAINMGKKRDSSKLKKLIQSCRKHLLNGKGALSQSKLSHEFGKLVDSVALASVDQLSDAVREYKDDRVMPMLVNALGASGTSTAHEVVRNVIATEAPRFLERYLQALSLTSKINADVMKDLRAWMDNCKESESYCRQIPYTLANLHRRNCEASKSRMTACNKDKDNEVSEFIAHVTTCETEECNEKALQILMNLPVASVVGYANQFLCSTGNRSLAPSFALKLLSLVSPDFIDAQLVNKLVRIFRDACPLPQSTTEQTLATDILLTLVLEHTSVGTYLLRSESNNPDNHEKWAFFYDSLAQRRKGNDLENEYWTKMRKFRVFRPNYAQRSLSASSNVFGLQIAEDENYLLSALVKTEFSDGNFKRSDFSLGLKSRRSHYPLLGISTDTSGLESFLSDSEEQSDEGAKKSGTESEGAPMAFAQLNLLNSRMLPASLFNGYGELMNAVWNANGDTFEAFNMDLLFRQHVMNIPLLSGLSLTTDVVGAASLKLSGAVEISLWNRDASSKVATDVSLSLDATITLVSAAEQIAEASSLLQMSTSVTTDFDVEFHDTPYLFCTVVSQGPLDIERSYAYGSPRLEKRLRRSRTVPPRSFALDERTSRMCAHMTRVIRR